MSLFERMERRLERGFNGVFAKAFRSEVQPLELASAVRRAMDDRATLIAKGRTVVPNLFTIELSTGDYDRLLEYDEELEDELIAAAEEHAETQRYRPGGPLQVIFDTDDNLETGVFRVRPATARQRVERRAQVEEYQDDFVAREGEDYDEYSGPMPQAETQRPAASAPAAPAGDAWWDEPADTDEGSDDDRWEVPTSVQQPVQPAARPPRRPRVQDRPWLEVDGERYPLMGAMTVLGRDDSADVVLDDPGISRRHAEVRITTDGPHYVATLRDLGSTNGTYVNGEQTDAVRLRDGDRITVGRTSVQYRAAKA